jgi:transcriptional regulator with XRE-family HTH domain
MVIGNRLKELRESQGDIEKRTGLLRCYISRVERTHSSGYRYPRKDGTRFGSANVPPVS